MKITSLDFGDLANTLAKSAYSDSILAMKNKKEPCLFFIFP